METADAAADAAAAADADVGTAARLAWLMRRLSIVPGVGEGRDFLDLD